MRTNRRISPRPQSGIDYLRLIEQNHERERLSRRINYHELGADGEHDDDDDGAAGVAVPVR